MASLARKVAGICIFFCAILMLGVGAADRAGKYALQLSIDGAIGPATQDYIERAMLSVEGSRVELIIIRMDTPGGLDTAMRGIIKQITASSVPVVTYVAPTGSRAASAGTYILYASHIAAMAPGTNLGAATPVQIGGISPPGTKGKDDKQKPEDSSEQDKEPAGAKQQKVINDAVAYIRGLAELRGRNQDWAEKAVREAASLQASAALKLKVIDLVAVSVADLLKQLHDREVSVQGKNRTLQTTGLAIIEYEPDWRSRILGVITNPNIAYILMLIGIYGLIFEFSNPGAIVPGTVGAICLLLALYAFQLLPINYAGVGLILLGLALMVGEAFQPSFGILGIGGTISFVIGSVILMDTEAPGFGIDISVIITFTIASALMFFLIVGMAVKARRRPVVSGMDELLGGKATVLHDFEHSGKVRIHSETWQAQSDTPLQKGQQVRVAAVNGLILKVVPMQQDSGIFSTKEE